MKDMKNAKTQNTQFLRDTRLSVYAPEKPLRLCIPQYIRL